MKGFSTSEEFYSQPKDIQHAFIYGWSVACVHGNENISKETNCHISEVRDLDDKGACTIQYTWTSGVKDGEPICQSREFYIVRVDELQDEIFAFLSDLDENVNYDYETEEKSIHDLEDPIIKLIEESIGKKIPENMTYEIGSHIIVMIGHGFPKEYIAKKIIEHFKL